MEQILDAVHETALNSQKSAKNLATRLGMSHQVLLNKANPYADNDHFTFLQVCGLIIAADNPLLIQAMARSIGYNLRKASKTSPADILPAVLSAGSEQGDVRRALLDALDDGVITRRESKEICLHINEVRDALDVLEASVLKKAKGNLVESRRLVDLSEANS